MAELVIKIPQELEEELAELSLNWEEVALEAIKLKAFELRLQRSAQMRRIIVEAIASKSGLSEEEADAFAIELGRKMKKGRAEELKRLGVL